MTNPQGPPTGPARDPLSTGAFGPAPGTPTPSPAPVSPQPTAAPATSTPATSTPATSTPATSARTTSTRSTGKTIGRTLALALLLFVTVILALFVVFNTQTVDISLVFADVQAPLVLALLIAAVLGGLFAGLAGAVLRARRRSR